MVGVLGRLLPPDTTSTSTGDICCPTTELVTESGFADCAIDAWSEASSCASTDRTAGDTFTAGGGLATDTLELGIVVTREGLVVVVLPIDGEIDMTLVPPPEVSSEPGLCIRTFCVDPLGSETGNASVTLGLARGDATPKDNGFTAGIASVTLGLGLGDDTVPAARRGDVVTDIVLAMVVIKEVVVVVV